MHVFAVNNDSYHQNSFLVLFDSKCSKDGISEY